MILGTELDGFVVQSTSSFPYQTIGPVDFANTNFVDTCQTDYYYNESSTPPQLLSEVKQCSNQYATYWTLAGTLTVFVIGVILFAKIFRKKVKA